MGVYDRDYIRDYRPGPVRPSFRGPNSGQGYLIGGSIVTTLIAINVAILLLESIIPAFKAFTQQTYVAKQGNASLVFGMFDLVSAKVLQGQVWRLFTAQYLHANLMHLLFNMIGLHFLGRLLESRWSPRRFFFVYTMCGLAGNLFYVFMGTTGAINPLMPAVGASGCIYGLLGLIAIWYPHLTVFIYFLFPVKVRTLAIVLGFIAFFSVQTRGANYGGEACHLAGLVFGLWWAAYGDAWWAKRRAAAAARPSGGGTRPVQTRPFVERLAQQREQQEAVDRVLKKVYEKGVHSLTEAEKKVLRDQTAREQAEDARFGRNDRV